MKQKIFFDIARKLKLQSLQPGEITEFQVVSGSMRPLFSLGDTIFVRKTLQNEITTGDIIVWTPAPSEDCMTHRVLNIINQGDSCSYVTRGDNNIYTDGKPIFFL